VNHYDGETMPGGVTVAITAMAGGTGTPDLTSALAAVPDEQYLVWLAPYTDAALLTELETELQDRWGPTRQNGGVAFSASGLSHSSVAAIGEARNSEHLSIMGSYGIPNPVWEVAAAVAGQVGGSAAIDPARPFQTLELDGLVAPKLEDRWTDTERNLLLFDGIATARVAPGSRVVIERLITTYQQNDLGADDIAFLDVNSPLTVERLRYDVRQMIALKYPRHKLGDDGKNYAPGQDIVTPKVIKAELIALFREWEEKGWVEAPEQFAQDLIVERNATDPNRLDIRMSPDLMNQLRVVGAQISFIV
jgi:phage tail sheath gpL-like